jgi:hypothetical protein
MEIKIPEESSVVELKNERTSAKATRTTPRQRNTDPLQSDINEDSFRKTGGRLISGKLEELSLPDLLQMLATTQKTGRLILSKRKIVSVPKPSMTIGDELGSLYLQNGELVHVEYNGMINEEAFFALLPWEKGYFALFPQHDFSFTERVEMPVEGLLLEGFRRLDEQRASRIDIKPGDTFDVNLDEPLTDLSPDELSVFQMAWKHKSAAKIWQNSELAKEFVTETLRTLLQRGFIVKR